MDDKKITEAPTVEVEDEKRDLAAEVEKMEKDRDTKVHVALKRLEENLTTMAKQYRTASGIVEAAKALKDVGQEAQLDVVHMASVSCLVADAVDIMAAKLHTIVDSDVDEDLVNELRDFCEDFYKKNMYDTLTQMHYDDEKYDVIVGVVVFEVMALKLCQFAGSATQDIADFIIAANEEIEKVKTNEVPF